MESQLSDQRVSDHAANLSQLGGQLLPMRQSEMLLTAQLPRSIEPHRSDITPVTVLRRDIGHQTQSAQRHCVLLVRSFDCTRAFSMFRCLLCGFR
ncbi:hypothetical protein T12_3293 [Trichinella patagoniensis]|uniref:Uncharacterized protein n=1 Tax=Trichinella patagoniensis TaxID=990121 RepID=A0A0V0Z7G5_9BILA|nr:hypothetical protein T12_3293 [Trichinella patagoniensis]